MIPEPAKREPGQTPPAANANVAGATSPKKAVAAGAAYPRTARQSRMAQAFAQIVAVLMRDPSFRNLALADLEWLVLPPVMAGQFKLGHAQARPPNAKTEAGILVPVAVALWARVSPDIDKGLSEHLDKDVRLRPTDWASGDIVWLMAAAGDRRAIPLLLKQLHEAEFKDRHIKLRARGPHGKVLIKTLDQCQ